MSNSKMKIQLQKRAYKKVFQDVTAEKSTRIKHLQRMVEEAKDKLAKAEATYNSYASKSELFDQLHANASNTLSVMTDQENLASDLVQKVNSLFETATVAIGTANDTYSDTKKLLQSVQRVVDATLAAATDISLSGELIMKRKAANPLISSELVSEASRATTDAGKAVSLIINALTSTFNALATANQASNTAEIVQAEILYLKDLVVRDTSMSNLDSTMITIQERANQNYINAREAEKEALSAADEARQQMMKSKNELNRATAELANAESALNAAEAAVGS
ncbi:hypothetical protein [Roseivirga thermotolerans]|uniref:Uncharacterized protein n=1 Tax=Roseivirga thermotolerans TaxID=1758176 RepID=A0ABQ3I4N1_9BACT|nr:hypothetical protein [Roseivirga thermotolerans]GHE63746.1 hypothetical protein GCM10011340_18930 [Roseivirga thermotolerans]